MRYRFEFTGGLAQGKRLQTPSGAYIPFPADVEIRNRTLIRCEALTVDEPQCRS
jgi:hypothetical protein